MIPNITKGTGISGAIRYNMGEGNEKGTNIRKELAPGAISRSEILGGQNFGFEIDSVERVEIARRVMEFNGSPRNQSGRTKKCRLDAFHASLSWEPGQEPAPDEMREAARSFLKALGMERAQAVFFVHTDTNARHLHIVASRVDPTTGKTFSDTRDKIAAQAWGLKWEREHDQVSEARKALHHLVDAVKAEEWEGLANALTDRNPTFSKRELDRALAYAGCDEMQAARFREKVLRHESVIGLRETIDDPITRYTTRSVLEAERAIMRDTKAMAEASNHAASFEHRRDACDYHQLTAEQWDAVAHATKADGFAMIAGQAGTGKSRAMAAIRDTYEAEGCKIVGLAWTNSVVDDLRSKGFANAATVSAELGLSEKAGRQQAPAAQWDEKTVVMVDEAAMLATKDLAAITQRAREAGAKLILVGDDKQLGSIERGGMYAPLRAEHGAAEINQVQRIDKEAQREAFTLMHAGEFRPAIDIFEKEGALKWAASADKAEAALAKQYTADAKAQPGKSRFIYAHTNSEVDRLNGMARDLAREGGKLGVDHELATKHGAQSFAAGDRVQLTGNASTRQGKDAGFVNGAVGTITSIEIEDKKARVGVQLDNGKALSFAVGAGKGEFDAFRHGYAGTIHKGQGKTIDETYVLVSKGWQADSSYVAMSRHRESVSVHVPKDVAADKAALARLMGRDPEKRAASGYEIDPASLARSGLVAKERAQAAAAAAPQNHARVPWESAKPAATSPAEGNPAEKQARGPWETDRPTPKPSPKQPAGDKPGRTGEATKEARNGSQKGAAGAREAAGGNRAAEAKAVASKAAKAEKRAESAAQTAMRGAAKVAEKALDGLASIFESLVNEAPSPEQRVENAKFDAEVAKERARLDRETADRPPPVEKDYRVPEDGMTESMRARFPAETLEARRMRLEQEERERDDRAQGRTRGR